MKLHKYYGCLALIFFSVLAIGTNVEIHQHKSREIRPNTPIPKIELAAYRDVLDGVNVHIEVASYVLNAPDLATKSLVSEEGFLQGHAHVFVNGIKRQRLYGKDIHIPKSWLKDGVNQVAISLNSHQHENWVSNEHNIVGSIFLDLSKEQLVLHNFTSQPIENSHAHH
jgi:hypothetical protein